MTSNTYVIDTHALLWFLGKSPRLSSRVRDLIRESQSTDSIILVPTIVLAEALSIIEKKRVQVTLGELLIAMRETNRFEIVPLDLPTFERMTRLPATLELHDRVIAATAQLYDCPLLSRDAVLSATVTTIW
jgi:PIN domain nuclease of toxin-antitoxin system